MNPEMQNTSSGAGKTSQSSLVAYTIVALGLALFIRFFIAAPYIVQGASMEPGFQDLNYLIIDRVSYTLGEPQRGDVIVFDLPQNASRALIKRVIGLPGESVIIDGNAVTIVNEAHPEGLLLKEPYVDDKNFGGVANVRTELGQDEYFVLGDNRRVSADSRVWGVLPREDIVGRVFVRLFPVTRIGFFPGVERYVE
jgi:signal peptidase I